MIALRLLSPRVPLRFAEQVSAFARLLPALSSAVGALPPRSRRQLKDFPAIFDIQLLTDAQMTRLNTTYRGKRQVTDVLSFSYTEGSIPAFAHETAGEICISLPQAARQARAEGHKLLHELIVLTVHGALHLMGYDHEKNTAEAKRMSQREAQVLGKFLHEGLPAKGLIER